METQITTTPDGGQVQAFENEQQVGLIDFTLEGGVMSINHTRTFPGHEGKGVAGAMTAVANQYAVEHQLKVLPICSYAWAWYQRHPEHKHILDDHAGEGVSCQIF